MTKNSSHKLLSFLNAKSGPFQGVAYLFLFSHSGKDDTCDVHEDWSCMTQAIVEKVVAMLASAHFFAILSCGSQAQ